MNDTLRARLRERWWATHYGEWLYGHGRTRGLAALRCAAVVVDTLTRRREARHGHRVDRALRRAAVRDYAARRWLP